MASRKPELLAERLSPCPLHARAATKPDPAEAAPRMGPSPSAAPHTGDARGTTPQVAGHATISADSHASFAPRQASSEQTSRMTAPAQNRPRPNRPRTHRPHPRTRYVRPGDHARSRPLPARRCRRHPCRTHPPCPHRRLAAYRRLCRAARRHRAAHAPRSPRGHRRRARPRQLYRHAHRSQRRESLV